MEENKPFDQQLAILILSCDKNNDLWSPCLAFFKKYWKDCPYKIYLASNFLKADDPDVVTLNSNQFSDWSTELKAVLPLVKEPYILVMLEDYFIYEEVNTGQIRDALMLMISRESAFFMLAAFPEKYRNLWNYKKIDNSDLFAEIDRQAQYLVNLQAGIWDKKFLFNLLEEGESPWQFEVAGSKRFSELGGKALCIVSDVKKKHVHGPITYLCGALTKGVVMRDAIRLCRNEAVTFIPSGKKIETVKEELQRRFYIFLPIPLRKVYDFIGSRWNSFFKVK